MSNYPPVSTETAGEELNRLHREIENKMRSTVADAMRAGEILAQVKGRIGENFAGWVDEHCSFQKSTAYKYLALHEHRSKIPSVGNLQDAYRKLQQIETEEKQTENQKAVKRIRHFIKTGEKREGWRRGTDDKLAEEERARDERIEKAKAEMESARVHNETEKKERDDRWRGLDEDIDLLGQAGRMVIEKIEQRQAFKERIRLSQSGESDQFIEALMDYLDELADDSRRIEACQNIIKVCRNVAAQLQT